MKYKASIYDVQHLQGPAVKIWMADKSGYMCRYIKIDRFYGSKIRLIDQRMGNLCKINLFLNYLVGSKESPGRKRKREEGRVGKKIKVW